MSIDYLSIAKWYEREITFVCLRKYFLSSYNIFKFLASLLDRDGGKLDPYASNIFNNEEWQELYKLSVQKVFSFLVVQCSKVSSSLLDWQITLPEVLLTLRLTILLYPSLFPGLNEVLVVIAKCWMFATVTPRATII